jgi:MYXO-CTERM domain-containing protein
VAKTDCTLIPISEKQFLFLVHEAPFSALTIMRSMGRRIRQRTALFGVMPWPGGQIKSRPQEEFVVCGITEGKGSRKYFGALLLGAGAVILLARRRRRPPKPILCILSSP